MCENLRISNESHALAKRMKIATLLRPEDCLRICQPGDPTPEGNEESAIHVGDAGESGIPSSDQPNRDDEREDLDECEVEKLIAAPSLSVREASMETEAMSKEKGYKDAKTAIVPMYLSTSTSKGRVPF